MSLTSYEAIAARDASVYHLIADSIPHIVWLAAVDGRTTYFNQQGTDYTGLPATTNYGWNWLALVHPEDADRARRAWEQALASGTPYTIEFRLRRFDGAFRWHQMRARPIRDRDAAIDAWIGTATDIDDHKQLELEQARSAREAQQALSLLRSIGSAAPIGLKVVDRDMNVLMINDVLAGFNGRTQDEHLNRSVAELWPDVWPTVKSAYERALRGETVVNVEVSVRNASRGGQIRYVIASFYPVRLGDEIIGVANIVFDITDRKQAEAERDALTRSAITAMAAALEVRDPYTAGHQRRVADLAGLIATRLQLASSDIEGLVLAASIHDLGKIAVPAEILTKPATLSSAEFELIKTHSRAGYDIVNEIPFPWPVAEMILQHHERLDGSGYPDGLEGDQILIGSRIIAVADTLEAMSSDRPYRRGLGLEVAVQNIRQGRGSAFDPEVVDACISLFDEGRLESACSWSHPH